SHNHRYRLTPRNLVMRSRSVTALAVGLGSCLALFAGLDTRKAPEEPPARSAGKGEAAAPRVLPGVLADGTVQLPNQWRLRSSGGLLGNPRTFGLGGAGERLVVGGLAMDAAGRDLFACCTWGDLVVRVPVENPENRTVIHVGKAKPAAKAAGPKGEPPSPPDG